MKVYSSTNVLPTILGNDNQQQQHHHHHNTTSIQLTNSLDPIQTSTLKQEICCAKLVSPSPSSLTTNNNLSATENHSIASSSAKNHQTLYYSVFKLNESLDSPTTNMLIENGKLLYSPTTATSIVVSKTPFSTLAEKVKSNPCNYSVDTISQKLSTITMNDSKSNVGESNLKIVQQRSSNNTSSDEDDTTALSGDSNYFNEEDLESEETSDNSDSEEEVENVEDDDSEEEDDDDYFDDDSDEDEENIQEYEEDWENSNEFWFGIEEPCHVSRVLQLYCNFFGLNAGRSANSRLPTQFIGKICRVILNADIDDDIVRTFDIVDIYERTSNLQYGAVHRKLKTSYVETQYDNEGLPKKFRKRKPKDIPDESDYRKSSWLYSFPIYGTLEEYHYESSLVDKSEDIGYADLLNRSLQKFKCKQEIAGSPNDNQLMYTPCQNDDDDSDEDWDSDNSEEDSSIPNYMKDLVPHLSGRGYLDTDRSFGYFEDDK